MKYYAIGASVTIMPRKFLASFPDNIVSIPDGEAALKSLRDSAAMASGKVILYTNEDDAHEFAKSRAHDENMTSAAYYMNFPLVLEVSLSDDAELTKIAVNLKGQLGIKISYDVNYIEISQISQILSLWALAGSHVSPCTITDKYTPAIDCKSLTASSNSACILF